MARQNFSRKVRKQIIDRANGFCEGCEAVLKPGEGEVDHTVAEGLRREADKGRKLTADDGKWLCNLCHPDKTRNDVQMMRKADRARDKASGAMKSRSKLKSKGFEKVQKTQKIDKSAVEAAALKPRSALQRQYGRQ